MIFRRGTSTVASVDDLFRSDDVYYTDHPPLFTTR